MPERETGATAPRGDGEQRAVQRVTLWGMAANVLLAAGKFAAGLLGHSHVLVADAVHSLSDLTTDLAILIGVSYWTRPADEGHPHGHRRAETVVTLGIGLVLLAVAIGMSVRAAMALATSQADDPPSVIALVVAIVGVALKELVFRWTMKEGRRLRCMPLVANAWHHRSDALSSIPAAIAIGIGMLAPGWAFVDHVGVIIVSLIILLAAARIIRPALNQLLDAGAPGEVLAQVRQITEATDGVLDAHRVRSRYVGCNLLAVDLHIHVDGAMSVQDGHDISEQVKQRLLDAQLSIADVVVHLEPGSSA